MSEAYLHNDGLGFLQTAEASLRIRGHMDLFLWLQGDVQNFLPHEVLVAAWGDFSADDVRFDILSPLPRLRTESIYALGSANATMVESCKQNCKVNGGKKCGAIPFLHTMRDRWHGVGCSPYAYLRTPDDDSIDFICNPCDSGAAGLLQSMRSCLVHGLSDQRGKLECIYVFLSTQDLSDPIFRRSLRFLLPYVDYSLRQVAHLAIQLPAEGEVGLVEKDEPGELSGLSQREVEIMEWVRIGKTNYEIGMILNISAFTVKNHLQRIFRKLDASNRAQAVQKLNRLKSEG